MLRYCFILIACLFISACSGSFLGDSDAGVEPTPIPTSVVPNKPTYQVQEGLVQHEMQFDGRIAAAVESRLVSPMDGAIGEIYVKKGDLLKEGDLIALLDTQELEKQLILAQSELEIATERLQAVQNQLATDRKRAELQLAMVQLDVDFARAQADEPPTAEQAYQIASKEIELQLAQLALDELNHNIDPLLQVDVDQATLKVSELEAMINNSQLLAPREGQIQQLKAAVGQPVQAGQPIGLIGDINQLEVKASLPESQLTDMAEELPVTIRLDNRPSDLLNGTVRRLPYPYGSGNNDVGLTEGDESTRISIDESQIEFEIGQRVQVTVLLMQRENALWLPPSAIRTFNGRSFVVIKDGEGQRRVDVKLGIVGDERIEIVAGVEEGQTVIGP